jgi:hypothetical protein
LSLSIDDFGLWGSDFRLWREFFLFAEFLSRPLGAFRRSSDHGDFTSDGCLIANRRDFGCLFRSGGRSLFADVGDHLIALFFADGSQCVAKRYTSFFAQVDEHFAVEPEITGQGKNSNLQNTNPLDCRDENPGSANQHH